MFHNVFFFCFGATHAITDTSKKENFTPSLKWRFDDQNDCLTLSALSNSLFFLEQRRNIRKNIGNILMNSLNWQT